MTELLIAIALYCVGFWIGKRVGIAETMMRMQGILDDLHKIQNSFKNTDGGNL